MYESFQVRNYRCFDNLELEDFERVNLIAGKNNVGKTALLEALFIHSGGFRPKLALTVDSFRGMGYHSVELGRGENPWHYLFNDFNLADPITFKGKDIENGERKVELRSIEDYEDLKEVDEVLDLEADGIEEGQLSEADEVLRLDYEDSESQRAFNLHLTPDGVSVKPRPPNPKVYSVFLDAEDGIGLEKDAEKFGKLKKEGKEKIVVDILKEIEPRLENISILPSGDRSILHGDIGLEKQIPLASMGGGMNHLASIVLAIADASGGMVLIDEVENGLHYSVLENLWNSIDKASKTFDTQVFATTHSLECIKESHKYFRDSENYDFRLFRMQRNEEGKVENVNYNEDELEKAIKSDLEVR